MCDEYEDAVYLAYKPPYWDPRNVALCVPPGARCKLKRECTAWRLEARADGVGRGGRRPSEKG